MMQQEVSFESDGRTLRGTLHLPDGLPRRRAAFLVLHGFGSNRQSPSVAVPARLLEDWGYAVLRFDMRGCGESEGERGRLICQEQVRDTQNALSFLQTRPEIDLDRIGCLGTSFGAAVTVYAAGVDKRIGAAISCCGWGDGETKFKAQHSSPDAWAEFVAMMNKGRDMRARGEVLMVPRFSIVPINPNLRSNLASNSIMEFHFDTVESMYEFRAIEVVADISPRPLLLLHGSRDSVTPTQQSIDMFARAGNPTDMHLVADVDHFVLADNDPLVIALTKGWLDKHFPSD